MGREPRRIASVGELPKITAIVEDEEEDNLYQLTYDIGNDSINPYGIGGTVYELGNFNFLIG